jgi:translation initiation factor IF-2
VAEMEDLKANPNKMATGVVIEAELDKNRGPIATVLVQSGTLKVGDNIMSGLTFGKVKAMFDENGKSVKTATPSTPVAVLGFNDVPFSGDQVFAVDEKLSKNVISERKNKIKEDQSKRTSGVSLDDFMNKVNQGKLKSLNIIIKADVQGSVEALKQTLTSIENEEVRVVCIHSAVGAVTESDLVLAQASGAIIVNFNLKVMPKIQTAADKMKVEIKNYNVIYECVEELTDAINGMMTVKYEQVVAGHAEVRVVFKLSTYGLVAGSYVKDGKIIRGGKLRIYREDIMICEGGVKQLKRFKDDVKEVNYGYECGCAIEGFNEIRVGDIIECYVTEEIKA